MHRMYIIAGLVFLLMVGSFGVGNDDDISEQVVQQYGNGIDMHTVNMPSQETNLDDLVTLGIISEVDKQTSANGIRR